MEIINGFVFLVQNSASIEGMGTLVFIMLVIGIIFFIALVYMLFYAIKNDKPYSSLLRFFLVPIFLIMFPIFQINKFDGIQEDMQGNLAKLETTSLTPEMLTALAAQLVVIENSSNIKPETIADVGKGKAAVQDTAAATEYLLNKLKETLAPDGHIRATDE